MCLCIGFVFCLFSFKFYFILLFFFTSSSSSFCSLFYLSFQLTSFRILHLKNKLSKGKIRTNEVIKMDKNFSKSLRGITQHSVIGDKECDAKP